jgi:hypothetical protein
MSIIRAHKEYILERLHKEFLLDGVIPTADQLEEALSEYMQTHPNLNLPIISTNDYSVLIGEESRASLLQEFATDFSDDINIATTELKDLSLLCRAYYERWSAELSRLFGKAKTLEHTIDSLLLLQSETSGYFATVVDSFADLNKIDQSVTTARINTTEGLVSYSAEPQYSIDASGGTRLNLLDMVDGDVRFSVLSSSPANYSSNVASALLNAFTSKDVNGLAWLGTVTKQSAGAVVCELKARVSRASALVVSKISFLSGTAVVGGGTILCQWSLDGYQWYAVGANSPLQTISATNTWVFPATEMCWIKFIFTKNNYDESSGGTYYYKFGARMISLYGHSYDSSENAILQSIAMQGFDSNGEVVPFASASIDACEEIFVDSETEKKITDIEYYLSASSDGEAWTDWVRVEPSCREIPNFPSIASFSGLESIDNVIDRAAVSVFDSTIDPCSLTRTFDYDEGEGKYFTGYNFKDIAFAVVNTAIPAYSDEGLFNINHLASTIEVWRNIFDSSDTTKTVRGIPRGWSYNEADEYSCYFYVTNSAGILLDFGSTTCIIDDVVKTGKIRVYRGVHVFKTTNVNWLDISSFGELGTETELKEADTLYPYNHKLILEGYQYPETFVGTKLYSGVDIVAQYYGERTTSFALENNLGDEEFGYFAFVKGVGTNEKPSCAILLRRDLSVDDNSNELCRISWRSGETNFNYIKLKCVLTTVDSSYTPVLSSYRIKLGI